MRSVQLLLLIAIGLGLVGCGSLAKPWRRAQPCPVALVPSESLPQELLLRQRIRIGDAERQVALDLIVQSRDGALTVVGLAPFGVRAFAIRQVGTASEIEDRVTDRALGVKPVWILDALHRTRFIVAPDGGDDGSVRRWQWAGETIIQTPGQGERPDVREYRLAGATDTDDAVRVEYPRSSAMHVSIRNPWCGYRALIETQSEERRP